MKKSIIPFLTLLILFSCSKKSEGISQSDVPELINKFLEMHVKYHTFNDQLSERTLNNYILTLDYGKYYFYKKDVDQFEKSKDMLDDYVRQDNYDLIFKIAMVYKQRVKESMALVDEFMKYTFNFKLDEKIVIDRDSVDFAKDKADMKERWRKSIKLQLLNYMSTGKGIEYAKKKLLKKYKIASKRAENIDSSEILSRFLNAYSMALDPHSNYLTHEEDEDFKISMELKLEGIGVRLKSEDGFVIVESIIPGGAADKLPKKLKLKPNDKIIAVSQGDSGDWTDVVDMDLRDVVKKIRGKQGTEVRLTVMRETGTSDKTARLVIPIVREEIKLQDSDAKSDVYTMSDKTRIGYIRLPSFYQDPTGGKSSAGDMFIQIDSLKQKKVDAIVVDLRGNPGGLLREAIDIAGLFIDRGPVVQIKDSTHMPQVYNDPEPGMAYSGPLVILIDKTSASASEILTGAIKDYRRGLIIGSSNTYGKGTVQSYNELEKGKKGAMKVTTHIFYQPSGSSNQLNGIVPDLKIPDINSIWDIGEKKAKYPLQWQPIPRAPFTPDHYVTKAIAARLQAMSQKRVQSSADFTELKEKISKFKKQLRRKTISLKEESTIEKQREKQIEKNLDKDKGKNIIDVKDDIFLREAFNVTRDYIRVLKKR